MRAFVGFDRIAVDPRDPRTVYVGGAAWVNAGVWKTSDAGEHWMRVQPVANGESLTADIIGVEFTDTLHGRLTTSNQETWTTADSGQTWQRP